MHVPCPVEFQGPWSPMGYRVVEITDETASESAAPSPTGREEPKDSSEPMWLPWDPVEPETKAKKKSKSRSRQPRPREQPARKPRPLLRWGLIAAGACGLLLLAVNLWPARPEARVVAVTVQPTPEETNWPTGPACAGNTCKPEPALERPAERESFGTTVQFVRNPLEAARLATAERKLTFLLHVSGNFEEAGFT